MSKPEAISLKDQQKFTSYQVFLIAILTLLQFTVVFGYAVVSPLGDTMMRDLHIDTSQFGFLISGYAFGACVSGFFSASIADKFDRKKFLLFFYTGFLIGTFLCGLAKDYHLLLVARTLTGVFGGVIGSIVLSIVADIFVLSQRGRVMGFIQMAFSVSQIVGIPFGIFVIEHWMWNDIFLFIGVLGVVLGFVILFKMQPIKTHLSQATKSEKPLFHLWKILTNKKYFAGFALVTLVSLGGAMIMPFSPTFLINNIHIAQSDLIYLYMASGIASIFIMIYIGKLSDIFPKRTVFLAGAIVTVIMTMVFTTLSPQPLWVVILINIVMLTGINGRLIPTMALNTAMPSVDDRGGYMSLCSSFQQLSNGLGAMVSGLIIVQRGEGSPLEHFDRVGIIVSIAAIICIFLIKRVAKQVGAR